MFWCHVNDLNDGDIKPIPQTDNRYLAIKTNNKIYKASNICPHQGSLITSKTQHHTLGCQYHNWTWDQDGIAIGSGTTSVCNNINLKLNELQTVNGLVFNKKITIDISVPNLNDFILDSYRIDNVNADYRNIMDLFLDVDHIDVIHKMDNTNIYHPLGINSVKELDWHYYDWGSIQTIKVNKDSMNPVFYDTMPIEYSVFWMAVYPDTMIEWQPGGLFITIANHETDNSSKVHVYKYRDHRYNDITWQLNDSIWETAWQQDKYQAEQILQFNNYPNMEQSKLLYREYLNSTYMK